MIRTIPMVIAGTVKSISEQEIVIDNTIHITQDPQEFASFKMILEGTKFSDEYSLSNKETIIGRAAIISAVELAKKPWDHLESQMF